MLAYRKGWRSRERGRSAASCRPDLEQLENRLAPAIYHVNTLHDTVAADLATGQDASGQVSLRSAVNAASASLQGDIIILGDGVFAPVSGSLEVRGNLQIIGQGPARTMLEARHLERLFDVRDGNLHLTGLTLDGDAATNLLDGDVHLTDCQIAGADLGAALTRLLASQPLPAPAVVPPSPNVNPTLLEPQRLSLETDQLTGQPGGVASQEQPQELVHEAHQSFWRSQGETPIEPAEAETPDDVEQGCAAEADVQPNGHALAENETTHPPEDRRAVPVPAEVKELAVIRLGKRGHSGQAILMLVVAGIGSAHRMLKNTACARAWDHQPWKRRLRITRRHDPHGRRTRGPPAYGPPFGRVPRKQGRQRCLPCSFHNEASGAA